ncbi:MAG: helix-turn-helix domain-containing protein [Bacillota bacterium]
MHQDFKIKFGKRIKEIRKSQGLTQRQLAKKITEINIGDPKFPYSSISAIENGKGNFSLDKIFYLANGLGVETSVLFKDFNLDENLTNRIKKVKEDYTEINEIYLDIFSYCDKLGIKLSETKDYYLLFKIIKTLQED